MPVDDPDATTLRDQPVSILVTANDVKPDPAKLEVRTAPKDGTAVVQEQPRTATSCTPCGFTGTASFTYDYCRSVVDVTARAACRVRHGDGGRHRAADPADDRGGYPNPTPPNREVEVTGTTGSCSQAGRLILHIPSPGTDVAVPVTGAFTERLRIPGGTFVGDHWPSCGWTARGSSRRTRRRSRWPTRRPMRSTTPPARPRTPRSPSPLLTMTPIRTATTATR